MDNNDFNHEKIFLDKLKSDDGLFEREFKEITNAYVMVNSDNIHNFLKENLGVVIALKKATSLFSEYVPYSKLSLKLVFDPIFVPQLVVIVKAPEKNFYNGFKNEIQKINKLLDPLIKEFEISCEFFIFDSMIHNHDGKYYI